jgi:hypothetical protein
VGHWKTTTFIGALRQDRLVAPCAFDGPINGEKFHAICSKAAFGALGESRGQRATHLDRDGRADLG